VEKRNITVLLVDDEKKFLDSISERIRLKGFEPFPAASGEEALEIARKTKIHAAVVDQKMPGMDGLTTIAKLKEMHPGLKTVLLTGYGNQKIKEAAEALDSAYFEKDEMRAFWDFIRQFGAKTGMIIINPPAGGKDTGDREKEWELGDSQKVAELEARERYDPPRSVPRGPAFTHSNLSGLSFDSPLHKWIGETASILKVRKSIQKVASLDCPVLIQGETGTGKERVARTIHMLSQRKKGQFVTVNCGSFNEELLRKELFGQGKGATGAPPKHGVFEAASGGTILLDEIGDTPVSVQAGLLRVLEEQTIIREGGTEKIPVEVRILAATERSLKRGPDNGTLREDLYSRLNAYTIGLPPLRERREDIPLLCSYFLDQYRKEFGKEIKGISDEILSLFLTYPFPGNIGELENAIERAVIVCEGDELKKEHLPQSLQEKKNPEGPKRKDFVSLAELNEQYILEVMQATRGNKSEAARILGITRASLWRKLKEIQP
jgi:DNA-binding NtrC family response regulator